MDAFPEGGSIVTGGRHRLALLARDLNGDPALCEGRVLDEKGECVSLFRTDRRGLTLVDLSYEKDRSFHVQIDRPANVKDAFPLPGATGHAHALRIERQGNELVVSVRGKKTNGDCELILATRQGTAHESVHVGSDGEAGVARFPIDGTFDVGHLLLKVGNTAELKCPVFLGTHWPVEVAIAARPGRRLPGDVVTLDVVATERGPGTEKGQGVAADLALSVTDRGVGGVGADLPIRSVLAPHASVAASDLEELDGVTNDAADRRTAWLLVHDGYAYPREGVPLPAKSLPAEDIGRAVIEPIPPRVESAPPAGKTAVRATGLERLVERAPFTRFERPRETADTSFGPLASEAELAEAPRHGKKDLPQDAALPGAFDCRDTRFWKGRVTTDRSGHATISFRVGSEVSPLVVSAEGFAKGGPVSATASVQPEAPFAAKFAFPGRLTVGDDLDVYVEMRAEDELEDPIQLSVQAPPALTALERTELTWDPKKSERVVKFRFHAAAPVASSVFRVVATRGSFRVVSARPLTIGFREVELSCSKSGYDSGTVSFAFKVPANAIPGSLTVAESVRPTAVASAEESVERLLQEPHGCFEQTTSTNYPNLLILEALLARGADAQTLERATMLVKAGFERILTFQEPETGGFALWQVPLLPEGAKRVSVAEPRYTAMAIVQLARYAKLFSGKGSYEIQKALAYLERDPKALEGVPGLHVALAIDEAGVAWKAPKNILHFAPQTSYERALLANVVATWASDWPLATKRGALQEQLLDALARDTDATGIASAGLGLMGSAGEQLAVETTALAATAFHLGGRDEQARFCVRYLAARKDVRGGWCGTQATALAVRAIAMLTEKARTDPVIVDFVTGSQTTTCTAGGERNRPVTLSRPVEAAAGTPVSLMLNVHSTTAVEYTLGYTYRIATPVDGAGAPYRIGTRIEPVVGSGADATIEVSIEQLAPVEGQVVARIGIPGGCVATAVPVRGASSTEVKDGSLVIYWEKAPGTQRLSIPVKGGTPGNYIASPSVIYPYYESGKEAFAPGLALKVVSPYGATDGREHPPVQHGR
jgi:hypothetical protein